MPTEALAECVSLFTLALNVTMLGWQSGRLPRLCRNSSPIYRAPISAILVVREFAHGDQVSLSIEDTDVSFARQIVLDEVFDDFESMRATPWHPGHCR